MSWDRVKFDAVMVELRKEGHTEEELLAITPVVKDLIRRNRHVTNEELVMRLRARGNRHTRRAEKSRKKK